jgi:hypothetical protein
MIRSLKGIIQPLRNPPSAVSGGLGGFLVLGLVVLAGCNASTDGGNPGTTTTTTSSTNCTTATASGSSTGSGDYTVSTLTLSSNSASFTLPSNVLSLVVSATGCSSPRLSSLMRADGTNVLGLTSPNGVDAYLVFAYGHSDYVNFLVPLDNSLTATSGSWTVTTNSAATGAKVVVRSGTTSDTPSLTVQPYLTGTTYSVSDLSTALTTMQTIYSNNGVTLTVNSVQTISGSQYTSVSPSFIDSTTSALLNQGSASVVNLFFVEDFSGSNSGLLGISAGIPGSLGVAGNHNGVLIGLTGHAEGGSLPSQLLAETAAHEMGHFLGLYHPTEREGTLYDPISDTPQCSSSNDSDGNGNVSAEECESYGGGNVMFWTAYSTSSRNSGKTQDNLTSNQVHVIRYSPLAQ